MPDNSRAYSTPAHQNRHVCSVSPVVIYNHFTDTILYSQLNSIHEEITYACTHVSYLIHA